MRRLLLFLVLASCTGTSTKDLEAEFFKCKRDQVQDCDIMAKELDRRRERDFERQDRVKCKVNAVCLEGREAEEFARRLEQQMSRY